MRRLDDLGEDMLPAAMKIQDSAFLRDREDADGVLSRKNFNSACLSGMLTMRRKGDYFDIAASAALNIASNEPFSLRLASAFSAVAR